MSGLINEEICSAKGMRRRREEASEMVEEKRKSGKR